MCLLDFKVTHLIQNPNVTLRLDLKAKVTKPILSLINVRGCDSNRKGSVGIKLSSSAVKFKEYFTIIALNGFDAILHNIFLKAYYIDILKGNFKLKIIVRLVDKLVS
jgi:hypothetical protein